MIEHWRWADTSTRALAGAGSSLLASVDGSPQGRDPWGSVGAQRRRQRGPGPLGPGDASTASLDCFRLPPHSPLPQQQHRPWKVFLAPAMSELGMELGFSSAIFATCETQQLVVRDWPFSDWECGIQTFALKPIRLISAQSSASRNRRGLGLPTCASGVTVPTSKIPNPIRKSPLGTSPLLS